MLKKEYISIGTQDRIYESIYNYKKLKSHFKKRKKYKLLKDFIPWLDEFRFLFNNFLISIMSIKDTLDKDYNKIQGYKDWWNENIEKIKKEFFINFISLRNAHQHENNGFITYVVSVEKHPNLLLLHLDFSFPRDQIIKSKSFKMIDLDQNLNSFWQKQRETFLKKSRDSMINKKIKDEEKVKNKIIIDEFGNRLPLRTYLLKTAFSEFSKIQEKLVLEGRTILIGIIIKNQDEVIDPEKFMEICDRLILKFNDISIDAYEKFYHKIKKGK